MVTTVHNCVQCSHSIQQYNTHKHSSTMLSVCLCNRATICCLYKHFARYNTLRHTHTYYGVGFEFSLTLNSGSNSNSSNTDLKCTQFSGIHNPWHVAACVRDVIVLNWIELSAFLLFSLRLFLFFFLTYPFSYVESHIVYSFQQWTIVTECSTFIGSLGKWFLYMHWTNFRFSFSEYWRALA